MVVELKQSGLPEPELAESQRKEEGVAELPIWLCADKCGDGIAAAGPQSAAGLGKMRQVHVSNLSIPIYLYLYLFKFRSPSKVFCHLVVSAAPHVKSCCLKLQNQEKEKIFCVCPAPMSKNVA